MLFLNSQDAISDVGALISILKNCTWPIIYENKSNFSIVQNDTVSPGMGGLKIAFVYFMERYKIESISPIYDFLPTVSLESSKIVMSVWGIA